MQNDLVIAWGLDFQLQACINGPPHEHIGVVDTQWVVHEKVLSLGSEVGISNLCQQASVLAYRTISC